MGLGEVKHAITEKTRLEVQSILDAGKQEADKIVAEAQKQIDEKRAASAAKTTEMVTTLERKELGAAHFAKKSILLEEKRKAIDAVIARVRERLENIDENHRRSIIADLASQASKTMTIHAIICNTRDADTLRSLFPQASITIDEHITGGFFADNPENTIRVDFTFESMLATVRERNIAELIRTLFT